MAALDDFNKAQNKIDRQYGLLEDGAIADIVSYTRDLMTDISAILSDSDFTTTLSTSLLNSAISGAVTSFQVLTTARISQLFEEMHQLGIDSVIEPLEAIGEYERQSQGASDSFGDVLIMALGAAAIVGAGIADGIRQSIGVSIRLGQMAQSSTKKIMANIRRSVARRIPSIKMTIRTETTRIFNMAHSAQQTIANKLNKSTLLKQWVTVGDNRVRPTHRAAGRARPIPINQLFRVGRDKLRFPGDPRGSAEEVINCRCRMKTLHPKVMRNVKQTA